MTGNLGVDQPLHQLQPAAPALNLDRLGAALLHKAHRVGHALGDRSVIRPEGHVSDEHRPPHRPPYRPGVVQHLVHSDGQGAVETHHHHGQRVADRDHVNA